LSAKTSLSRIARKKTGVTTPSRDPDTTTVSRSFPWLRAARYPSGTPTTTASSRAVRPSSMVAGNRSRKLSVTGRPVWMEEPKSPCSSAFT